MRKMRVTSIKSKRFDRSRVRTTGTRGVHTRYVPESIVEKTRPCKRYILLYFTFYFIFMVARCDTQKNSPTSQINVEPKKASTKILFHPLPFFFVVFFSSATSQWSTSKPMKSPKPALAKHLRFHPLSPHWMALGPTTRWAWVPGETRNNNTQPPQQHRNRQKNNITEENQGVSVFWLLKN